MERIQSDSGTHLPPSEWKGGKPSETSMGKVLHKLLKTVVN